MIKLFNYEIIFFFLCFFIILVKLICIILHLYKFVKSILKTFDRCCIDYGLRTFSLSVSHSAETEVLSLLVLVYSFMGRC